jgi:hypothetical protein
MISNKKAFLVLKQQNQALFDFTVLTCQAVPALKGYMKAVDAGAAKALPDADYFRSPPDFVQLRGFITSYKKSLGRLVLLSSFSYFEAYFKDFLKEVIDFHGGEDAFAAASARRLSAHMDACDTPAISKSVAKLREYRKKNLGPKYEKHIKLLEKTDFRFPSELFATFGLMELRRYSDLKAEQIPRVAKTGFGVDVSQSDEDKFKELREKRNSIAHGTLHQVDLTEGIKASKFLREFSIKIDQHVVKHFLVIERP